MSNKLEMLFTPIWSINLAHHWCWLIEQHLTFSDHCGVNESLTGSKAGDSNRQQNILQLYHVAGSCAHNGMNKCEISHARTSPVVWRKASHFTIALNKLRANNKGASIILNWLLSNIFAYWIYQKQVKCKLTFYSIYWMKCYAVWLWANKKWITICQITRLKPQFPFHIVYLEVLGHPCICSYTLKSGYN